MRTIGRLMLALTLANTGCLMTITSPIPATNPLDDRTWVEVYNHSPADIITLESRGHLIWGKEGKTRVLGVLRGKSIEFPLVSFTPYDQYRILARGWQCQNVARVKQPEDLPATCKDIGYQILPVFVQYSNRNGDRPYFDIRQLQQ